MRHGVVLASTGAAVAWLIAFRIGAAHHALYPALGGVAACVVIGALVGVPALRDALRPRRRDLLLGALAGAISLGATHLFFPPVAAMIPDVGREVARLYAVAAVTPLSLVPVALVVLVQIVLANLRTRDPYIHATALAISARARVYRCGRGRGRRV